MIGFFGIILYFIIGTLVSIRVYSNLRWKKTNGIDKELRSKDEDTVFMLSCVSFIIWPLLISYLFIFLPVKYIAFFPRLHKLLTRPPRRIRKIQKARMEEEEKKKVDEIVTPLLEEV